MAGESFFGPFAAEQFTDQGHIPAADLFGRGRVVAGEMERVAVVLEEQGFEVGQRVVKAKESPHVFARKRGGVAELYGLQAGKLGDERLVDDELLAAVGAGRLELMRSDAGAQEVGHLEMGIAQQGGNILRGGHHLRIERAAAVAHQHVGVLARAYLTDQSEGLGGMLRQVWREHLCPALERLPQGLCRDALSAGKEAVKEQYFLILVHGFHTNRFSEAARSRISWGTGRSV